LYLENRYFFFFFFGGSIGRREQLGLNCLVLGMGLVVRSEKSEGGGRGWGCEHVYDFKNMFFLTDDEKSWRKLYDIL